LNNRNNRAKHLVMRSGHAQADAPRWILLIHQIPPRPNSLRVKIWRQLQRVGAVAIKNSVYALPRSEAAHEDFQWIARAVVEGGGDASICEARFAGGLTDDQIIASFVAARDADYAQIAEEARRAEVAEAELARLQRRLADVVAIDFFGAPGREPAEALIADLERRARPPRPASAASLPTSGHRGRTWVTRKGIHVDRIASAWLIRRSIDPDARFVFVPAGAPRGQPDELRFDMFEADFTHEGDRCTFEVLVERFGLVDPGLRAIAEIVHDIDLKDDKFGRAETAGIAAAIAGIALVHRDDEGRLQHGAALFDALHALFRRKPEEP